MNTDFFIAKRVASFGGSRKNGKSFSRLIIRIAVVAVALSVSVMIIATAMISGFKNEISEKIFGFWGHIHITGTNINRSLLEPTPIDKKQTFYPFLDTVKHIGYTGNPEIFGISLRGKTVEKKTEGGIKRIRVFALKPGIIKAKDQIEGIVLKGVDKDFGWDDFNEFLIEGRRIEFQDSVISRDILISKTTADRLEVKVGDKFIIHFVENNIQLQRRFKISGIFKTGLEEYDKKIALVDIRQIQKLLNWSENEVGGFEIFLDNIDDLGAYTDFIYYDVIPKELYAENIKEKFPNIFEWLKLQNINGFVIIFLMLIVSVLNMITALLILILERSNMIGILKSLGERDWNIRKIFLYYASWIIINGLFWGNIIGIGLLFLQKQFKFIKLSEADYYLSYAPVDFNLLTILGINLLTLIITLIFLVLPTWLVTKVSPVKTIRFK